MKRCPRCHETYSDELQNFCLNDGELLVSFAEDAPPTIFQGESGSRPFADETPTVMMDPTRVTNPTNWGPGGPLESWQTPPAGIQPQAYGAASIVSGKRDQTLPTVSLILGILGLVSVCCWGGIPFGAAAFVTGFLGMKNAENNPAKYGGRGLAVGGMVLGIVSFLVAILFLFIGLAA